MNPEMTKEMNRNEEGKERKGTRGEQVRDKGSVERPATEEQL